MAKKNIAAAGYARRSSDLQERSVPDQKAYLEKWAKQNGYRIVRWYVDDAISGTSTKGRDQFERMITDAEAKQRRDFEAVLCYDISRFSRGGTNETGFYLHRLSVVGVHALFPAEGIPEGDEGELLQGVKSWQARQYSVKLSRDCIRGTISHIMDKRCAPGGVPPYGYDKQHCTAAGQVLRVFRSMPDGSKQEYGPDGKLVRVLEPGQSLKKAKSDIVRYVPSTPERVGVVQRIYQQCVDGFGYQYIAHRLNEEGIISHDGGGWSSSQVKRILENPAYRGAVVWNRRSVGKLNGVARDGTLRPKRGGGNGDHTNAKDDWFVVEDAHEPLVSPATFEKARKAIDARRGQGGLAKTTNRSLLSGLIRCTHCGYSHMQQRNWSMSGGKRVRYRYYIDGGYHRQGKSVCIGSRIPGEALDRFVLDRVKNILLGDDGWTQGVDAFVRDAMARLGGDDTFDANAIEKELDAINRRIKAMVAMLADPTFDGLDELKTTLVDLKQRRDALRARLEERQPGRVLAYTEADLREWADGRFRQLEHIVADRASFQETRDFVHAHVAAIEIDPHAKRGVLRVPADAMAALDHEISSRVAHEDCS